MITIGTPIKAARHIHFLPRPTITIAAAEIMSASCEARVTVNSSARHMPAKHTASRMTDLFGLALRRKNCDKQTRTQARL